MKLYNTETWSFTRQRTCPPIGGSISHRKYGDMTKSQNHFWKVCVKILHATYYRFYISLLSIKIFKHVQIHSLKQNWNFAMTFFQFYEMWASSLASGNQAQRPKNIKHRKIWYGFKLITLSPNQSMQLCRSSESSSNIHNDQAQVQNVGSNNNDCQMNYLCKFNNKEFTNTCKFFN